MITPQGRATYTWKHRILPGLPDLNVSIIGTRQTEEGRPFRGTQEER
jgi:hypothetical protein